MALNSDKAERVAVIGRWRVGKTFLVRPVYGERIAFEISSLQNGNTEAQLQNFALAVRYAGLDDAIAPPQNWIEAFFELSRLLERRVVRKKWCFSSMSSPGWLRAAPIFCRALAFLEQLGG